jgi:hypothetical protein
MRRKCPEKWVRNSWFLLHGNAPAHRPLVVEKYSPSTMWRLWNIRHIPRTFDRPTFPCYLSWNVFCKDKDSRDPRKALQRRQHWQTSWTAVSMNPSKRWRNVGKACHFPRNRCKVTYFCMINPFWEVIVATCTPGISYNLLFGKQITCICLHFRDE